MMNAKLPRPPYGLAIAAAVLLVIGFVFNPVMKPLIGSELMETNIFLLAVPFLTIFVAILLTFIFCIFLITRQLNNRIPVKIYRPIEYLIMAGIVLGIIGMFQPWTMALYQLGFTVLLVSTLSFIVWSHVIPKSIHRQ